MAIMVTVTFPLQDGKIGSFLEFLGQALVDTRAFDGCVSVKTNAAEDGSHVLLVEEWESKPHQEAYIGWRVETGLMDALAPYISAPPEFGFYEIRSE